MEFGSPPCSPQIPISMFFLTPRPFAIPICIRFPTPLTSIDWKGFLSRSSFSMYSGRNLPSTSSLLKLNVPCVRSFVPKLKNSAVSASSLAVSAALTTSIIVPKLMVSFILFSFSMSFLIVS